MKKTLNFPHVIETWRARHTHMVLFCVMHFLCPGLFCPPAVQCLTWMLSSMIWYIQILGNPWSTLMPATVDCPNTSSSLWLRVKPWDDASRRGAAHRLLCDSEHAYYLWVSLRPVQHIRLSGLDKEEKESGVHVLAPEAGWRNTLRWGVERGDATTDMQWTYWVHPQAVYECVWFGSGKGVGLAVSAVVEVTWDRGLHEWTDRGEGSGVEEARKYRGEGH